MTTTRNLIGAPSGVLNVDLPVLDFSNMVQISAGNGYNNSAIEESAYVLASGDENHPVTVRISFYENAGKNGVGERTTTLRVNFYAIETDDTSGDTLIDEQASVSITTRVPGVNPTFEEADYLAYVLGAASIFFQTVTGTTPDTDVVDKLKYSIGTIL